MLQDLLLLKKITQQDFNMYATFGTYEPGIQWLTSKVDETFMEEPPKEFMTAEMLAYIEGRRSLLREIIFGIKTINILMKEQQNVGTEQPG